ncbi:MAG: hypothetical protein ACYCZO_03560 [Daejeonella sp.]
MKVDTHYKKEASGSAKCSSASKLAGNSCLVYAYAKSQELLHYLTVLIGGSYATLSNRIRKFLLHYFEALETVVPVIYELPQDMHTTHNLAGEEHTYRDKVSSQDIFASFKRHPE